MYYLNELYKLIDSLIYAVLTIEFTLDFFLQASIFITGLIGQYLVAKRNVKGFYFWILGNLAIILVSIPRGLYGMATLYVIYTFFSIYSIKEWSTTSKPSEKEFSA